MLNLFCCTLHSYSLALHKLVCVLRSTVIPLPHIWLFECTFRCVCCICCLRQVVELLAGVAAVLDAARPCRPDARVRKPVGAAVVVTFALQALPLIKTA